MGVPIDRIEPNTEGNDPKASVQRPYDCHLSTRALKDLGIDVSTQDFVGWWRRRRAAIAGLPLQVVGDTNRGRLKSSPLWSPAYLLAALEWAEDGENKEPAEPSKVEALVAPPQLARKTAASNSRPKRAIDDVKTITRRIAQAGPTVPCMDLLPENLVPPSSRNPAYFLPAPSISFDTAVKPLLSSPTTTTTGTIGPGPRTRYRQQHQRRQQQSKEVVGRRRGSEQEAAAISTSGAAQQAAETDRIVLATERKEDGSEGKQTVYQSAQSSGMVPPITRSPSPPRQLQSPVREAFGFFSRARKKSNGSDSPRSTLTKRSRTLPTSSTSTSSTDPYATESRSPQSFGINPDAEMPRSLTETHNPQAKSVGVRCRGVTVPVEVTKETTTDDLLLACSQTLEKLKRPINSGACVVIEACLRPGLERRLRRYERVWDVINAWDPDSPNTLIALPDSSDPDGELRLSSVPNTLEEPAGFVLPLYHYQRQGRWSQRYITLKENGQIFASKKRDAKPSDKDVVRLCHLSDFDLYMPTETEMKKRLKPPRRYCYAIRSQERASLFVDSDHYVQFFCTDDPNVARKFRSCVQSWRSWYLVNKKLRLHETQEPALTSPISPTDRSGVDYSIRGRVSMDHGSRGRRSVDLPASAASVRVLQSSREDTSPTASGQSAIPPIAPLTASLMDKNAAVFAANGLLGNGYDERRQQALRKETLAKQQRGRAMSLADDAPFADGPSLLNNRATAAPNCDARPQTAGSDKSQKTPLTRPSSPDRAGWFPSAVQHSAEQRSGHPTAPLTRRPSTSSRTPSRAPSTQSQQQQQQHQTRRTGAPPQQPLIDLTPTFVEPPQWSRENRGHGVRAPQGKPLVDLATGPALPPSTAARFRDAAAPPKNLVRRPEPGPGPGAGTGTGTGTTLLQQYDEQQQRTAARGRGNTVTGVSSVSGAGMGLGRRNTVKSTASAGAGSTAVNGMNVPPPPVPSSAVAGYMRGRGPAMGVGEGERERARSRYRSVEGRARVPLLGQGQVELPLRSGRGEY
ncbi:hypothetical protein C8A03DRAFT_44216 [Achaetomium macrosporum]|uniref:PH domain-containing protein n=1 Tax=Achaetomium macrosporum TaxID=79813 RepID=A0AAN7C9N3_9PEZI|nr:hypothetical protein C8A03DRAFT_44216 [Achaetomium macrosporum]